MEQSKVEKQKWTPFFQLLIKSKLPWKWYIINLILALGLNTVSVKLPQLAGDIMQGKIFNRDLVINYVIITIVLTIAGSVLGLFGTWVDLNTDRNIEKSVWRKFIRMPIPFFARLNPSSLISRVTSDAASVSYGVSSFFNVINVVYTLIITLITVYSMNHKMVIVMSVLIPWVLIVSMLPGRFIYKATERIQSAYSNFTNYITERLTNLQLIKSSVAENFESELGVKVAKEQYDAEIYSAKINLLTQPFIYSVEAFCKAVVLIYGGILVEQKQLEMGQLIAMFMYVDSITMSVILCITSYQDIKAAQGSTHEISEILQSESEKTERKQSFDLPHQDIHFKNVSFSYEQKNIFTNLNLTIPKWKITAIVGPSGSGKTSILNMLERFYIPVSGQVKFGDIPMEDINLNEWRDAIGYVAQNSPILSGTIWDNIVYGINRKVSEDEVIGAAKLANAYEFIQTLPKGFYSEVGAQGSKLSGGERQRIAIARTIIKNPDFLLLDEATCSLDAQNEHEVQVALNNLMKGRTTVIVAHNIKTVINADNIVILDKGEINGIGQHDQLYSENELYRKYFDLQFN